MGYGPATGSTLKTALGHTFPVVGRMTNTERERERERGRTDARIETHAINVTKNA